MKESNIGDSVVKMFDVKKADGEIKYNPVMSKCMVPHPIKKGERLTIEGIEYVVTGVKKIDAPFYEVTIKPYKEEKEDE